VAKKERIIRIFYSDRISLKYLKIKIRNFLFFAVKSYMTLKITYTQSILQWKPKVRVNR